MRNLTVFTIGHSAHSYEHFLSLLRAAEITAVADVRTTPFSRHFPHFNEATLRSNLKLDGISYVFLGRELGGRPSGQDFYCNGVADYEKMANTETFASGIKRVIEGAKKFRVALMCSEHDPLDCHRCLLVGRALFGQGVELVHILGDGSSVSHKAVEDKLLKLAGRSSDDLLMTASERLSAAYRDRSLKVAYAELPTHIKAHAAKQ
ncbi:MAG: hypothetical protein QOF07_155 [Bradyrhizobium sp.]|nr:hypothetical protein [Bradyrhizobium sp.]